MFKPGQKVEARRRASQGSRWDSAVIVAPASYGALVRYRDGAELPRPAADIRSGAGTECERPAPRTLAVGDTVLFAPYHKYKPDPLQYCERAKLIGINDDEATIIVAMNSVCQHEAAQANADGVRRLTVPLRAILPNVSILGRRVLVNNHATVQSRYVLGTVTEDNGNTVAVQEDQNPNHTGRHIVGFDRLFLPYGRCLADAMRDEAQGAETWETDYLRSLPESAQVALERAAAHFEALGRDSEAAQVRAMLAYPTVDLLFTSREEIDRLNRCLDELERPTVDLSVSGVDASVTAMQQGDGWGYQYRLRFLCGTRQNHTPARHSFTGEYPSVADAHRAAAEALAAQLQQEYSVKAQQQAAQRLRKRLADFSR